jgi:hypothetical protein
MSLKNITYINSRGAGLTDSDINGSEQLANLLLTILSDSPLFSNIVLEELVICCVAVGKKRLG